VNSLERRLGAKSVIQMEMTRSAAWCRARGIAGSGAPTSTKQLGETLGDACDMIPLGVPLGPEDGAVLGSPPGVELGAEQQKCAAWFLAGVGTAG
jgi:hypothetical protein